MSAAASQVHPGPAPSESAPRLRLWPAVVILVVQWLILNVPGWLAPGTALQMNAMFFGAIGGLAAIAAWWLLASRARWTDRVLVLLFLAAASVAAIPLNHEKFNYRLYGPIVRALPLATAAWILWLLVTPRLRWPVRRAGILVAIVLALGYCTLLRFHGADGSFNADVRWRWAPTAEDEFLKKLPARQAALPAGETAPQLRPGDWPGFRGPNRDGRLTGVRIATDWEKHPPRLLWKHGIGPGWSSFAVVGNWLYTQEQRGPDEMVVCYDAATGEQRWAHADPVRFDEAVAGPGPRATPTFHEGRIYSLGAAGTLNCLDAATGAVKWSKNILADSGREKPPEWGFSSSPLVAKGVVTVFAGGPDGKGVLGYQADSGKLLWGVPTGTESYCSPHLTRAGGGEQVVIASGKGLTAFDPAGGKVLWEHVYAQKGPPRCAQPTPVGDSDLLIGTPLAGMRRVHVTHQEDAWGERMVWETKAIKPYFNDLVVYQDHAYGFDGLFFTCVRLEDGKGRWRVRGYGSGQVLLLVDQGVLLILAETGEVALVEANPDRHEELARIPVFTSKTWNHPVVAHGRLFVRNDEEVACFQLTADGSPGAAGE